MKTLTMVVALAATAALAACGDKPQVQAGATKGSPPVWQGTNNAYVAPGWKAGDQASWEEQMRRRAQGQNEYARIRGAS